MHLKKKVFVHSSATKSLRERVRNTEYELTGFKLPDPAAAGAPAGAAPGVGGALPGVLGGPQEGTNSTAFALSFTDDGAEPPLDPPPPATGVALLALLLFLLLFSVVVDVAGAVSVMIVRFVVPCIRIKIYYQKCALCTKIQSKNCIPEYLRYSNTDIRLL